jgi:hypothetical protein
MQGWALVIDAYRKLGLDQEGRAALQQCLVACGQSPFRDELVRGAAAGWTSPDGRPLPLDAGEVEQFTALLGDEPLRRLEHLKSLLADRDHAELEAEAELLLQEPLTPAMQVELLDVLGRSYQRAGNHLNAALCFARINPFGEDARRLRSEFLQQHPLEEGESAP